MRKTVDDKIMYHATHEDNLQSIYFEGLDPRYATGKRKAVWLVPKRGIEEGILHAAARHNWRIDEIVVMTVVVDRTTVRYSGNGMLFYSEQNQACENHASAISFIQESEE